MTTLESIKEYLQMLNPSELKKNLKEISTQDLIENWDDLSEDEEKIIFRNRVNWFCNLSLPFIPSISIRR